MQRSVIIVAVLLILTGLVWIAQGTGVFPVGGMANHMEWTYIGLILEVIAAGLIVYALRARRR